MTNGNGRQHDEPPYNPEAEFGLLSHLFARPDLLDRPEVVALVPGDLFEPATKIVYRHLVGAQLDGQSPEVLPARITAAGEFSEDVRNLLIKLAASPGSGNDAAHFAALVKETAERRKQWEVLNEAKRWHADSLPVLDIVGLLESYVETAKETNKKGGPITATAMLETYQTLRQYIIHGIARAGETINIVAASKRGKSWFVLLLVFCVVTGKHWLGKFWCKPGKVLLVDNELHHETIADRLRKVASALALSPEAYGDKLFVESVRGRNLDINGLESYLLQFKPGQFQVIVLDALYRFYPKGFDENSNPDQTWLYNKLDNIANRLQCVIICIIHSSKGSQADKNVVDVGSGAGAMARATDSHLVLRQHEEPDAVVLDLAPRSSPPLDSPICLRFKWPLWVVDENLDPTLLHRPGKKTKPAADREPEWTAERFAMEFGTAEPQTLAAMIEAACGAGLSERRASSLVKRAASIGKLHKWPTDDKREFAFATVPAPVIELPKPSKKQRSKAGKKAG